MRGKLTQGCGTHVLLRRLPHRTSPPSLHYILYTLNYKSNYIYYLMQRVFPYKSNLQNGWPPGMVSVRSPKLSLRLFTSVKQVVESVVYVVLVEQCQFSERHLWHCLTTT